MQIDAIFAIRLTTKRIFPSLPFPSHLPPLVTSTEKTHHARNFPTQLVTSTEKTHHARNSPDPVSNIHRKKTSHILVYDEEDEGEGGMGEGGREKGGRARGKGEA